MDHAEVIELIEVAAAEPDGLGRLTAGDTPEAAALAGHLAGCESCAAELARTARAASVVREVVREQPDPALRERTLAFVREVGRPRAVAGIGGLPLADPGVASPRAPGVPAEADAAPEARRPAARRASPDRHGRQPLWAAAGIAAVIIAGVAGFATGGAGRPPKVVDEAAIAMAAAQTTMDIAAQTDHVAVAMAAAPGSASSASVGSVLYSPAKGELAMTASGLPPLPPGAVYACWLEQGGQRRRIGVLYYDGANGTWAGKVSGLGDLQPGDTFGVSLAVGGDSTGTPMLTGTR